MRWQSKILFLMLFFPMVLVGILFSFFSMHEKLESEKKPVEQLPIQSETPVVDVVRNEDSEDFLWPEEKRRLEQQRWAEASGQPMVEDEFEEEYVEEDSTIYEEEAVSEEVPNYSPSNLEEISPEEFYN